jgi:hypothetical protein
MTKPKHHQQHAAAPDTTIADDLVWGAGPIGDEIGVNSRRAFYLLERGQIPARKSAIYGSPLGGSFAPHSAVTRHDPADLRTRR